MLNRISLAPSQSQLKLDQLSRELRDKIKRAKEIAGICSHPLPTPQDLSSQLQLSLGNLEQLQPPQYDPNVNYFDQYWKIYLQNEIHFGMIKDIQTRTSHLHQLVKQIDGLQDEQHRLNRLKNRKKNRRLACQIQKSYLCPYDKCSRIYGSDVSLNLHIKLKHNGGNKTDRQKQAEKICHAQENNLQSPEVNLNLPPGYLREYRKLYFQKEYNNQLAYEVKRQHYSQ